MTRFRIRLSTRRSPAAPLRWRGTPMASNTPSRDRSSPTSDADRTVVCNVSRTVVAAARARYAHVTVVLITASPAILAARLAQRGRAERRRDRRAAFGRTVDDGLPLTSSSTTVGLDRRQCAASPRRGGRRTTRCLRSESRTGFPRFTGRSRNCERLSNISNKLSCHMGVVEASYNDDMRRLTVQPTADRTKNNRQLLRGTRASKQKPTPSMEIRATTRCVPIAGQHGENP